MILECQEGTKIAVDKHTFLVEKIRGNVFKVRQIGGGLEFVYTITANNDTEVLPGVKFKCTGVVKGGGVRLKISSPTMKINKV